MVKKEVSKYKSIPHNFQNKYEWQLKNLAVFSRWSLIAYKRVF